MIGRGCERRLGLMVILKVSCIWKWQGHLVIDETVRLSRALVRRWSSVVERGGRWLYDHGYWIEVMPGTWLRSLF